MISQDYLFDFQRDTTIRLSFRKGDMLICTRYPNIFSDKPTIVDVWELDSGHSALISNRIDDLPQWFQLHPTEIRDSLLYKMHDKIKKGEYPDEPIDAPFIWRVQTGDRIIWIGDDRMDLKSQDGLLKILTFSENALLIGESLNLSLEQCFTFGGLTKISQNHTRMQQASIAMQIIKELGMPREMDIEWRLG